MVSKYQAGESLADLSTCYGVTEPSVRGLLLRRGVPIRSKRNFLRHDAFDTLTDDASYWIGFLFADGSVGARPGHTPQISISLAERDRDQLISLRAFLGSTARISEASSVRRSCQFSVRSDRLARRVLDLGRYSELIANELVRSRHFWRGVTDGDGSIGAYPSSARSPRLRPQFRLVGRRRRLEQFVQFLEDYNVVGLSVRPHKSIYSVGTTAGPARRIIEILYANSSVALARKASMANWVLGLP